MTHRPGRSITSKTAETVGSPTVIPGATLFDFDLPAIPAAGDIQLGHGRIWLAQSVGTVPNGPYEGSALLVAGSDLAVYVEREGKYLGSIRLSLSPLLTQMIAAFESLEAAHNLTKENE